MCASQKTLLHSNPGKCGPTSVRHFQVKCQGYGFSCGHVWMWELDCEKSWASKNWCFWTVVLDETLESPLDCKEIQPVHSKGDQPWLFFGRTDAKAETPILWPPHVKSWLVGKDSMLGGIGGRRRRDNRGWDGWMASWTLWTWVWVNSGSWWWTGRPGILQLMGLDTTEQLNWTEELPRHLWILDLHLMLKFHGTWMYLDSLIHWLLTEHLLCYLGLSS